MTGMGRGIGKPLVFYVFYDTTIPLGMAMALWGWVDFLISAAFLEHGIQN